MPILLTGPRHARSGPSLGPLVLAAALTAALAACSGNPSPEPSSVPPEATPTATPRPTPSPTPTPTPAPTPTWTNPPDEELTGLIPDTVGSARLIKPPPTEFAITPGDIGEVFGEIGLHFRSLAVAFIEQPRTSLYAMRLDQPVGETEDLRPHLGTIGQYVGIAGTDPEPWELVTVAGNRYWTRGSDEATLTGTTLYTWLTDEYAFLLIGLDDALNRSIIARLPGEPAPTPTPAPTRSPTASPSADTSADSSPGG